MSQGWKNEGAASPDPERGNRRDWGTYAPNDVGNPPASTWLPRGPGASRRHAHVCLVKESIFKWMCVGFWIVFYPLVLEGCQRVDFIDWLPAGFIG